MAGHKYLKHSGGRIVEEAASQASSGAADAGKIVALDATGKVDMSMLPTGIGAETKLLPAAETLAAGDLVNIFDDAGALKVRKADATTQGKEAHGFVLAAASMGNNATVYASGIVTGLTGLSGGPRMYLSTTAGQATATAPSGAGNVVQAVGTRLSATELAFLPELPVTLS
ncbi:MAG: hypothetical protein LDL30_03265 [Desulfovibrio sp.]|nr:hypothetical protein [Desulfovibrio sp.]MCA1985773.1 hypothetical protein [Desulfovibrio sp.]